MRQGIVFWDDKEAGIITETDDGEYVFSYQAAYLAREDPHPVSLTLPLRTEPYRSKTLFAFFDGLIPEGWLLDLSLRNWKLHAQDRMGLLLSVCQECIGNVSVRVISGAD